MQWIHLGLQAFLLFFLNYWLFYLSTHHITSGLVAVCFSTIPVLNSLNQRIFFGMPIRRQIVIGGALGLTGIALVFWHDLAGLNFADPRIHGIVLALLASYVASLGNISAMRNSRDGMPVLATTGFGMAIGAGFAFVMALGSGTVINFDMSTHYILSLVYLAVLGSVVAFMAYLTLIDRMGADRAGYIGVLTPVIALAISTRFEAYEWTWQAVLGIALIVIGNVVALRKRV